MKKNDIKNRKSIEFKILFSCLSIIFIFAISISIFTISSFSRFIINNSDEQSKEISRQIVYNYDNYISSIIDACNGIQAKIDNINLNVDQAEAKNYMDDFLMYNTDISNLSIFSLKGKTFISTSKDKYEANDVLEQAWFERAVKEPSLHFFSNPYIINNEYRILVSKVMSHNRGTDKALAMIELDSQVMINLAKNTNLGIDGRIIIVDDDSNIVYASINEYSNQATIIETINHIVIGTSNATLNGKKMAVTVDTINNTKWKIAIFINIDKAQTVKETYIYFLALFVIVTVLITTAILSYISKRISNPIRDLEKAMRKIENSDFLNVEEVDTTDISQIEVASLSENFNKMMIRIKELMDKVVIEQNAQRESELKALQNQINPHFLYNTLDSIVWLVENNKNKEAAQMVVSLAKLFRISISRGRNIITVNDEIEHAKSYLIIQSYRYADAFKYEFDVDDKVLEYTTMKLILQPLIENAIYHGLKNRIDEGLIKIGAHIVDDKIVFTVSDNGYGMKEEKISELYRNFENPNLNDGVGIKNVYLRLRIYYGVEANLKIDSELDEGTTIIITIPMKRKE